MPTIKPDEIIRSNRKTLTICIDAVGRLVVRAPRSCSDARIRAFIDEKESWILRKKAEKQRAGVELPQEDINGYEIMLLGKKRRILLTDGHRIVFDDTNDVIYLPRKNAQTHLVKWLKENAKRILTTVTERTAARMGTTYRSVSISSARRRWGSCAGDNSIRYTYRLIYAPKEVIEYVVIHELAHTKHKNHSALFWAEVAKYAPDWKVKRKWLKIHGALTEIF